MPRPRWGGGSLGRSCSCPAGPPLASPRLIRAAVEQGKLGDPRSVHYLTATLVGRQRKILGYWFDQVSPLDAFVLDSGGRGLRLCFDDLAVEHHIGGLTAADASWTATAFDFEGRPLGWSNLAAPDPAGGRTACVAGFPTGATRGGYTIPRLRARRGERTLPPGEIHLGTFEGPRTIGIHRH